MQTLDICNQYRQSIIRNITHPKGLMWISDCLISVWGFFFSIHSHKSVISSKPELLLNGSCHQFALWNSPDPILTDEQCSTHIRNYYLHSNTVNCYLETAGCFFLFFIQHIYKTRSWDTPESSRLLVKYLYIPIWKTSTLPHNLWLAGACFKTHWIRKNEELIRVQ